MENRNPEGHQANQDVRHPGNDEHAPIQPNPRVQLTPEEVEVLRQCNKESFWFRCVPLGITFVATSQLLVSRGIWKPHPNFGALYKNLGAGLAAFIIGKMSYQSRCREKILQLENSPLADSLRKSRSWTAGFPNLGEKTESDDVFRDLGSESTAEQQRRKLAEHDGGRVEFKGLDENLRPSMDRDSYHKKTELTDDKDLQSRMSYDDLRARNRKDYESKKSGRSSDDKTSDTKDTLTPPLRESPKPESEKPSAQPNVKRNKYGDIIES